MTNPLDPLANSDPFDDPMLDALERSIENPPGFHDPLAEQDSIHQDNLCNRLDALEAHIENAFPLPPVPVINDVGSNGSQDNAPVDGDFDPADSTEPMDNITVFEPYPEKYGTFESAPTLPQEGLSRTLPPNPPGLPIPRKGGGSGRKGRNIPRYLTPLPRLKGRVFGTVPSERYCPESHERIDTRQCESCEKYRHWPDGTEEKPRECWYDWQAIQSANNSSEEKSDEDE